MSLDPEKLSITAFLLTLGMVIIILSLYGVWKMWPERTELDFSAFENFADKSTGWVSHWTPERRGETFTEFCSKYKGEPRRIVPLDCVKGIPELEAEMNKVY